MSGDITAAVRELTLDDWLDAISKSAQEFFTGQLGLEPFEVVGTGGEVSVSDVGSYVALVGDETSAQIGMVASIEACRKFARKMLCMEDDEELDDGDMCDAVGEIANILGGTTKRLIAERMPGFKLGLPLFMQGRLIPSDRQEVSSLAVRVAATEAHLLVVRVRK